MLFLAAPGPYCLMLSLREASTVGWIAAWVCIDIEEARAVTCSSGSGMKHSGAGRLEEDLEARLTAGAAHGSQQARARVLRKAGRLLQHLVGVQAHVEHLPRADARAVILVLPTASRCDSARRVQPNVWRCQFKARECDGDV